MTNWKTTLSSAGTAVMALLTFVASMPYEFGQVANIFPPEWKAKIAMAGALATVLLHVINGTWQKDKDVTGGNRVSQPDATNK